MKKKVLVIGELNIDLILNKIAGFPEIGKEKLSSEMALTLGSSSAIFASNLASLGTDVSYLGMVGKDNFGDFIIESLEKKKVCTDQILKSKDLKTGITVVLNYDMDRAMVTYPGAMEELCIDHLDQELISEFDHVHISSIFLQPKIKEQAAAIFKFLKECEVSTSLDPQWDPNEKWDLDLDKLLPLIDVFLPNTKEFLALTDSETIAEGLEKNNENAERIVIKDGENGASLYANGELISKAAFLNKDVVDCIGAGDSFDAGFVHQFLNGSPKLECLEFANVIGAINTAGAGGTAAFENTELMKSIAKEKFAYNLEL